MSLWLCCWNSFLGRFIEVVVCACISKQIFKVHRLIWVLIFLFRLWLNNIRNRTIKIELLFRTCSVMNEKILFLLWIKFIVVNFHVLLIRCSRRKPIFFTADHSWTWSQYFALTRCYSAWHNLFRAEQIRLWLSTLVVFEFFEIPKFRRI